MKSISVIDVKPDQPYADITLHQIFQKALGAKRIKMIIGLYKAHYMHAIFWS